MVLFKEANLPRSLAMGALAAGSITFTMKSLPGSPQATNVVPTTFLGTDMNAGAFIGILSTILMILFQLWYLNREEKKCRDRGEGFTFMEGTKEENFTVDRSKLPSAFVAFLPMVVVVIFIIGLSILSRNGVIDVVTPAIVVGSMLCASALALLLNWDIIKQKGGLSYLKYIINDGTSGAIRAISGPAAIVGFGGVVQASPGFQTIVNSLLQLDMNTYLMAAIGPSVIGGVVGSSSGGLLISLEVLSETLLASDANVGIVHRIAAMFAGTFDSLPHSTVWFLMFPYLGLTHKDSYKYVWWTTVIIPTGVGIAILLLSMWLYAY
jgi:H+/gluconate symporter-like permease